MGSQSSFSQFYARASRHRRALCIACVMVALALLIGSQGCNQNDQGAEQGAGDEHFAAVCKGKIDVEGGVIKLAPTRDGVITEVLVEEGDFVKQGQVLATIDDRQAKLQLVVAEHELGKLRANLIALQSKAAAAKRELKRVEGLLKGGASAPMDLDQARDRADQTDGELQEALAAVKVQEGQVEVARFEVEQRQIKAPFDGRIVKRNARLGDGASTFNVTALFLFAPDAPRIVRADLDESFIMNVHTGMHASVVLEANDRMSFDATVKRLGIVVGQKPLDPDDPTSRPDTRSIELVLDINAPDLRIGQRVVVFVKEDKE